MITLPSSSRETICGWSQRQRLVEVVMKQEDRVERIDQAIRLVLVAASGDQLAADLAMQRFHRPKLS